MPGGIGRDFPADFLLLIGRRCLSPNCSIAVEDVHTVAAAVHFSRIYFWGRGQVYD